MRLEPSGLDRILAVRLDNVGDVVMLGPALRALRRARPSARITLMTSPAGCHAAPLLSSVDEVVAWRAVWQDASGVLPLRPDRERAMIAELGKRAFDAAFIFTSFSQSAWPPAYAAYMAGIPVRAGQARDFGGSLLTHRVMPLADCSHQVDRNLHLLESLGFAVDGRDLEIHVDDAASASADSLLRSVGLTPSAPFVVVAPSASCAARRYAASRFGRVIDQLSDSLRVPHVLVGGGRDVETAGQVLAATTSTRVRSLVGRTSLSELVAILRRARLLVGNNSAPMHLADAVACPMVILYSGTDLEEQWRPRRAPSLLLRRPTPCEPCYRFECPYQMECLDIQPADVTAACEEMWERTAHRERYGVPALEGAAPADGGQGRRGAA